MKKLILFLLCLTPLIAANCALTKFARNSNTKSQPAEYRLEEECINKISQWLYLQSNIKYKYIGSIQGNNSDTIKSIFQDTIIKGYDDNALFVYLDYQCNIIRTEAGGIKIAGKDKRNN
jgi:hypothetical protein